MKRLGLFAIAALTASMQLHSQTVEWKASSAPVRIKSWAYRETASQPGKFVNEDPVAPFASYENGAYLKRDPSLDERMYTFRADLALDASARGKSIALFMGPGDYPRDVYLNGVLLQRTGDHGERYNATVYYSSRVPLPPSLLDFNGKPNRIAVEAFPDYETSPLGDFFVGEHYAITRMVFARNLFNINLVQAALVVAFVIALFFVFLFLKSPIRDRRYLWCALMCFSFALGYSNMSFYNDGADDVLLDKLSRAGLPLTSLFLAFFTIHFTGIWEKKKILKVLIALPVFASIVLTSVQRDKQGVATAFAGITTNFVLTPLLLLTLGILIAGLARKRDASRTAVLIGFLVTIAASLHDIYFISIRVSPFCYLVAYGYLALLVSIFFVLALEQARVSKELALQSGRLDGRNRVLGEVVLDLTRVAEDLVSSSTRLESTISETLEAVENYGEENKTISSAFREQVGKVEAEIARIAERMAKSSERVPKALEAQTEAVEDVRLTLSRMKERIGENLASAIESCRIAGELSQNANEGARVIGLSRGAMTQVAEHSKVLQDVLTSIEDIAERTHVLSINAAIESARLGSQGRGFGVVAQEIRKLADQSRDSLKASFGKIHEMAESVGRGTGLSEEATTTLLGIVEQARASAERTEDMRRLIETQGAQSEEIVRSADDLLREARLLKDLSLEEKRDNQEREKQFLSMKESLSALSRRLDGQDDRQRELSSALDRMREMSKANAEHIARLGKSIEKAQS